MSNKKTLLIVLSAFLAVLIAILAICGVFLIKGSGASDVYQKQLNVADKYVESGDYDQAIAAYKSAIQADPDQDAPYFQLATLYIRLSRLSDAKAILEEGIAKTSSQRLIELYETYFGDNNGSSAPDDTDKVATQDEVFLSNYICDTVANYSFDNYKVQYSGINIQKDQKVYSVRMTGFNGVLYFINEAGNPDSVNESTGLPYDGVRPNYVVLDDLSPLFEGIDNHPISIEQLPELGAEKVTTSENKELGKFVKFLYRHCYVEVSLNSENCIVLDAANKLYSEFGTGAADAQNKEYKGTVKVVSATTGCGVQNAKIVVRPGVNAQTGTAVCETKSGSNGEFTVSLAVGKYTVEVNCEGYVVEYFDLEVFSTGVFSIETVTISPVLADGEIRIVLEWGDHPRDLDSHLIDDAGTDQVYYIRRTWRVSGETIAELDVDDTNGYGPETITVYDPSINFTYCVNDFTRTGDMFSRTDITVKVYLSDGSSQVFTVPNTSENANGWCVFSYINGSIVPVNTIVSGSSAFRYYN